MAAAVSSAMPVTTHISQYVQPVKYPKKGLRNSREYSANEPETGR